MIELQQISKQLGNFRLNSINLKIEQGDYYILLGKSGAGKSILLELIAGLLTPDSGRILIDGKDFTTTPIRQRPVGMVFQDFALFPHLTVEKNLLFPLRNLKKKHHEAQAKIQELAELMNITPLLKRYPDTLSGGEKQRVALARTLGMDPKILLLDEPLSAIDSHLKDELITLLRRINRMGITILQVTHHFEEAVSLADKVAVINNGTIIQSGTSKEVFHNPKSSFLARLTGIKNFYRATPDSSNSSLAENKVRIFHYKPRAEQEGYLMFRSEDVLLSEEEPHTSMRNNFRGTVVEMTSGPEGFQVLVDIGIKVTASITNKSVEELHIAPGQKLWVGFKSTAVKFIPHEK